MLLLYVHQLAEMDTKLELKLVMMLIQLQEMDVLELVSKKLDICALEKERVHASQFVVMEEE